MVRKLLLLDANVLIDYIESEPRIISLASQHIGPVATAADVLSEVDDLDADRCATLGIQILEPSLEQIWEANTIRGRLSFQDRLCMVLARDDGYVCVTNDRRLRTECTRQNIPILWGLELMVELVTGNRLQPSTALRVARSIQQANPAHITAEILQRFEEKLSS